MLQTPQNHNSILLTGLFLGVLLISPLLGMESARAGPDATYDRSSQCVWVQTSAPSLQTSTPRHPLHPEPEEDLLVNEDVNIVTGLYTRSYSRHKDGIIDYKTARQIVISEYNEYWNTVVETKEFPLLYWEDGDRDGAFDMWIDQHGEGSPCDIVPYHIYESNQLAQSAEYQ
ncbi:MAG: hypothetical protein NPIRA02_30820 [Nitrospirales bacterium]|nr:MAG: hypothetical protein NPIRA02_30820 [Nitrospirales bacterium]